MSMFLRVPNTVYYVYLRDFDISTISVILTSPLILADVPKLHIYLFLWLLEN
jgi:hypothetical protein